ncbi:MAG: tRNA (adenosine(37)-N6)-dimethylallyltransferase MiaA [Gemmatimonadaceae bacterium]|nr:tRNA (adenosine(37)-N6)-dimethylallyltransferase MiaA [Gemmatimonadaceae bacterium]
MTRPVAVLTGPTAAGKSALAMAVARATGAVLISADSRQVYRGFDIGTAKPSAADRAEVLHRGLDIAAPTDRWHAARWATAARGWIVEARQQGRPVLIVGGTGLWIRALAEPLYDEPPLDPLQRAALAAELAVLDTPTLRARVAAVDPARAHLGRAQLLRAIEVATLTGVPQSTLMAAGPSVPPVPLAYGVVDPGPVLAMRIAERTSAMFEAGWVDEVVALRRDVPAIAPAWKATGYDLVAAVATGRVSPADAIDGIAIATRQYAKRQRTWQRHQLPPEAVTRFDPDAPGTAERVLAWFQEFA